MRPREAALIVVRKPNNRELDARPHKFMPNKFVFPAVASTLSTASASAERPQRTGDEAAKKPQTVSDNKLRNGAAAIRETFEETGLIIGRPTKKNLSTGDKVWRFDQRR